MTGGWAATNTLREAIHDRGMDAWEEERPVDPKHVAALALVEAALDEAAEVIRIESTGVLPDFMPLANALKAVRGDD